jgi:hypothetical protein
MMYQDIVDEESADKKMTLLPGMWKSKSSAKIKVEHPDSS